MTTPDDPTWSPDEIEARRNDPPSNREPLPGVQAIDQAPDLFDEQHAQTFGVALHAAAVGTAAAMLAVAVSLLGTTEHPAHSNHAAPVTPWYGFDDAWCDMAVSYEGGHSGNLMALGGRFAYTPAHAAWFKAQGQWHNGTSGCRPGDIVFFDWDNPGHPRFGGIEHVGICERRAGSKVITLEGNIGDAFRREVRDSTYIVGYGRPKYATTPTQEDTLKTVVDLGAEQAQTIKAGQRGSLAFEVEYLDPDKVHTDADKVGRYPSVFPKGADAPYAVTAEVVLAVRPAPGVELTIASYKRDKDEWERDIRGVELVGDRAVLHSNIRMSSGHKYRVDVVNTSTLDVAVKRAYLFIAH